MNELSCDSRPRRIAFPIETPRLALRPFAAVDLEALAGLYGDAEVMRYVGEGGPWDRRRAAAALDALIAMQAELGFACWAVVERAGGAVVGECGLLPLEGRGPEIEHSYTLSRVVWGRGYATEAGAACLRTAFADLGLDSVVGVTHPGNVASRRVLERLGMVADGSGRYYGHELLRFVARPAAADRAPR